MNFLMKALALFFCGCDTYIIIVFAFVNAWVWKKTKGLIDSTQKFLRPISSRKRGIAASIEITPQTLEDIEAKKQSIVKWYTVYANITAIFPLLGILGTVASLITINGDDDMMDNLMIALGTTLLGVVCAIVCKVMDASISAPIEQISDDIMYITQRYDGPDKQEEDYEE